MRGENTMRQRRTYVMSDSMRRVARGVQWASVPLALVTGFYAVWYLVTGGGVAAVLWWTFWAVAMVLGWFGQRRVLRRDAAARAEAAGAETREPS
ncbi:hypothetical protein [Streptomyces bohaiensis]|uniref:DUF3329 domain-containing protein n=1 Tax=Streptomyces bohaiensis TaxID=1431344 RepID=A0ABX1CDA5_9ACTN|nr:hypothetical protein [Streptomyces bohaiensis]NJQ15845.1 hypothetical protein [Streptomyces bohaiensis]